MTDEGNSVHQQHYHHLLLFLSFLLQGPFERISGPNAQTVRTLLSLHRPPLHYYYFYYYYFYGGYKYRLSVTTDGMNKWRNIWHTIYVNILFVRLIVQFRIDGSFLGQSSVDKKLGIVLSCGLVLLWESANQICF